MKAEVIIPHLSTPTLDASLALCQRMLMENSGGLDVTVTIDPAEESVCPYVKWNRAAYASSADVLVFLNNDMLVMPGWGWLVAAFDLLPKNAVVTGYLIESGALAVNARNVEKDFGRHPKEFRRAECEAFALQEAATKPPMMNDLGWFMPVAFRREFFCGLGGYDTDTAQYLGCGRFPDPLDLVFFGKLARVKAHFCRANSWAYHFQRLSLDPGRSS